MVIWTGGLRGGRIQQVFQEIADVRSCLRWITLKVIIETSLLKRRQKILACQLSPRRRAQFVKTSSGFFRCRRYTRRYFTDAPEQFEAHGVKASGGIRDYASAQQLLNAGANRLGTSHELRSSRTRRWPLLTDLNLKCLKLTERVLG